MSAPAPVATAVVVQTVTTVTTARPIQVALPVAQPIKKKGQETDLIDAKLILDMPATRAYTLVDGTKKLVEDSKLELMSSSIDGEDVYLIVLGSIHLSLKVEIPCLEMAPRNFVFPTDGVTYGLVLADSITDDVLEVFRLVLSEHTSFRSAASPQLIVSLPDRPDKVVKVATSVVSGLGTGSAVVATGVIKGGKMVGSLIAKGSVYLTQKLKPNEKATIVSDETKSKIQKAKFFSGAACKVSKALVVGAMATTSAMSAQLSEAIKETKVGKKLSSDPDKPNERLDAAKDVGKATIGAVLTVYQALETAVFGVAQSAGAATVTVVTHKYGADAGLHTKEGLGVVENVGTAAYAMKQVGIKAIARNTVIKTGQEVLTTPKEREAEEARKRAAIAANPSAGASSHQAVIGEALGLPPGVDPMVALEAAATIAQVQAAAAAHASK